MNDKSEIALVTGASRGIGRAVMLDLAAQGYQVVGTATSQQGVDDINQLFSSSSVCGGRKLRLEEESSINQLFHQLEEEKQQPTILVANAGVAADNLLLRMKMEEWHRTLDINLTGTFLLCQKAVKQMVRKKWGRIVCLSSVVAFIGNPGQVNYATTKAGLIGLSRSLAREFASRNITVNLVAPGFIETDMTHSLDDKMREQLLRQIALHRYGRVEEVAAAVRFLVSEEAGYITGQALHINGGMYMG